MAVPDKLLFQFFEAAKSALLHTDASEAKEALEEDPLDPLLFSRRLVLNVQQIVLQKSVEIYQKENVSEYPVTITQVRERLGQLGSEANLSPELQVAMDSMNEAAKLALCKLVLYCEHSLATSSTQPRNRNLHDSVTGEGLDRTCLLEYFGLCQAALKLHSVKKFMSEGGPLFEGLSTSPTNLVDKSDLLFPQTRLEYVQQLLAKSMGWDPVFLTEELRRVFVQQDDSSALVHDKQVNSIFQNLVQEMQLAIGTASLQMKQHQEVQMLSDLPKGGNTRVVSVQYSEFEISPDGKKTAIGSSSAPAVSVMESQVSEEEQKRQIRLASEAAVLQQEILGELLSLPEHERNNKLEEAEQASQEFMKKVVALPPGQERIDFLRSVDPHTSRRLAMHKLWKGMLEVNGGKPPQLASKCNH
jgi:hypothetical protein